MVLSNTYIEVPTYTDGVWDITIFYTREEFRDFIRSIFIDAGPDEGYGFTVSISKQFNAEARIFQKQGYYCNAPLKSKDFMVYWDDQKFKCKSGVIYKEGEKTWYVTRDYYMWLNFLPIYDKEEKRFDFAKVRDAQYHMALYECLGELYYKHLPILKKRQIASSYFHMAKLINTYWFEEGSVNKIGASLKDYISEKGSWRMLNEYRNFLNEHTAWYRPSEPDKIFSWQQRIKVRIGGRDTYRGNKSIITGTSFEKDPTNGVGGPVTYFFHEEAGIAPKMMDTYEFMRPAMQSGMVTTGTFIAAGSVGDLEQCQPLKDMILHPHRYGMFAITSSLLDKKGTIGETGLFIPEQWSMPPYIDEAGNSLVKEALEAIFEERKQWYKDLPPDQYQLRISQKPTCIEEAFATRKESVFPPHLVSKQLQRIEDKMYPVEYLELSKDAEGKIVDRVSRKAPIREFPISKKSDDKEGVICIYERPYKNPTFGMYYASIDPIGEGKTTTSDSLCSIYILKNSVEVIKDEGNGKVENSIERDAIVASWCGRFDDINKTHERLEIMIEWYNAWTLVENNVALFIQYMISKKKQRYLVPKDMILFLKDIGANRNVFQEYGWKNVSTLFKGNLLSYGIEFLQEEIDQETDVDGTVTKVIYGVERIPDPMLLKEMQAYQEGLNVDRLVAFCSLVAFAKVQQSNRGLSKRIEVTNKNLDNSQKFSKLNYSPFRHIGNSGKNNSINKPFRNAFKNIR
jgi:hypothetical protein